MKRLSATGDTIVEVLIAMAIVSLVLAGAFASTSQSLTQARQAQERGEAAQIARGQLEIFKSYMKDNAAAVTSPSSPATFCIDDNRTRRTISNVTDHGTYPAQCRKGISNGEARYHMSVRKVSAENFVVMARWDSLGMATVEEVKINYRLK